MRITHQMPKILAALILTIALANSAGAEGPAVSGSDRVIIDLLRPVDVQFTAPTPLITVLEEKILPLDGASDRLPHFDVDDRLMFNLVDPISLSRVSALEAISQLASNQQAIAILSSDGLTINIVDHRRATGKNLNITFPDTTLGDAMTTLVKQMKKPGEVQFIGSVSERPVKAKIFKDSNGYAIAADLTSKTGTGFIEKDNRFYVFPMTDQPRTDVADQQKITLKVTNTPLIEVIEKLFEQTKGNYAISPDIGETRRLLISINLDEAPFEMALRSVLRMAGLVYRTNGSVYEILPQEKTTRWSILPSKVGAVITDDTQGLVELPFSDTQELNTRTFELKHIGINEVNALMGTIPGPKQYSVVGKKLIVSLNPDPLNQFVELLNQFDVPSAVSNAVSVRATIRITITNEDKTTKQYVASAESAGIESHEIPLSIITRLPVERQKADEQKSGSSGNADIVLGVPFQKHSGGDSALQMTAVVKLGNGTPFATVNAKGVIKLTGPFENSWTGMTQDFEAVVPVARDSEGVVARGVVQAESGTAEYEVVVTVKNLGPAAVTMSVPATTGSRSADLLSILQSVRDKSVK